MYQVTSMRTPTPDRSSPTSNGGRRTPTGRRSPRSYYERTTTVRFVLPSTGRAMCTKLNRVQRTKARVENNTCLCENFLRGHCDFGGNCLLAHVPKQYLWDFLTPSVNRDTYTYEKGFNIRCYTPSLDAYYDMPSEWIYVTRGSERYVEMYNDNGDNFKDKCKLCDDLQRTGCCQRGGECEDIHCCCADISQFPCIHTHIAEAEAIKHYPRLDKNIVVRVYLPNSSEESQEFKGDDVIRTAGATQYEEAYMREGGIPSVKMQHCAHFQNKKLCRLGDGCRFLHVISLALSTPLNDDDDGYTSSSLRNSPVDDRLNNPQRRFNKNVAATLAINSMMCSPDFTNSTDNGISDKLNAFRQKNVFGDNRFVQEGGMSEINNRPLKLTTYNLGDKAYSPEINNIQGTNGNTERSIPAKKSPTFDTPGVSFNNLQYNATTESTVQYNGTSKNKYDTDVNSIPIRTYRLGNPAAAPSRISPPKLRNSPSSVQTRLQLEAANTQNKCSANNNLTNNFVSQNEPCRYTNGFEYYKPTNTNQNVEIKDNNTANNCEFVNSNCDVSGRVNYSNNINNTNNYSTSNNLVYTNKNSNNNYENVNYGKSNVGDEICLGKGENKTNSYSVNNANMSSWNDNAYYNTKSNSNDNINYGKKFNNNTNIDKNDAIRNKLNNNSNDNYYYTPFPSHPQQTNKLIDQSRSNANTRISPTGKDRISPTRCNNPYSLTQDNYTNY